MTELKQLWDRSFTNQVERLINRGETYEIYVGQMFFANRLVDPLEHSSTLQYT